MLTEKDLKGIIRKSRDAGTWLEYHGPMTIGNAEVYEIWTTTQDDPHARWWMENPNGQKVKCTPQTRFLMVDKNGPELFDYFCSLAPKLHERFEAA